MCAIVGYLGRDEPERVNNVRNIIARSFERGRDGRGFSFLTSSQHVISKDTERAVSADSWDWIHFIKGQAFLNLIGNLRAEPTTEYVRHKCPDDQQPYSAGKWTIVHNGTIANDKELRTFPKVPTSIDSAAVAEILDSTGVNPRSLPEFASAISLLKGSFAILAQHADAPETLFFATNYRPIWMAETPRGVYLASSRDYFPPSMSPQMIRPYSAGLISYPSNGSPTVAVQRLISDDGNRNALVVCSGGLDSVVAATYAKKKLGLNITLLHFTYGSRAEGPEVNAVRDVAKALGVPCLFKPISDVYDKEDSPLLRDDSTIAGGEQGAEFAYEWVPARNLVMLSHAVALAEAKGFGKIILGNNLEEAGAYPDNEPEFIHRFNALLPFAVGDGKSVEILMPVGNLMKHEIVALGNEIGAPLDKTWSCYRAGELHCGTCGPCFMRKTAFEINGIPEVISYANS